MFESIVVLSRYVMLLYMVSFFFLSEKKQMFLIYLFHIHSFLILTYSKDTLLIGAAGFILILATNLALRLVYKRANQKLWNIMLFLMDIGLVMIARLNTELAQRQLLWFFVGMFAILFIPLALKIFRHFEHFRYLYLIMAAGLIVSPFIIGQQIYGSINWISIRGFSFQPSEIVKFLFVFYLASTFRKSPDWKSVVVSGIISASFVLVLVLQRDLGGALIFFTTYMFMLYAATGNIPLFLLGTGAAAGASVFAFQQFPHVQGRVNAWLHTWTYIDTDGYQIALGLFSIGTYGLLGSGLTLGYPNYNSVVERDMIFAAICEEFGSLFGLFVILLYLLLFYRGIEIALQAKSRFHTFMALGFATILAFQTFLILGGILRVIPLTGVTLPFISYGGSSVVVAILMIGILQWIHSQYEYEGSEE